MYVGKEGCSKTGEFKKIKRREERATVSLKDNFEPIFYYSQAEKPILQGN